MTSAQPPVVVLLGGPSAEHDVSVVSGTAVAEALSGTGHDVVQVLIDLEGSWWWLPADHRRADRPAAAYDDPAGLKGTRIGGAVVSEKHANFIVNDQKGTAADVRRLGDHVRAVVAAEHGIELAYEIDFAGDWTGWPWPAEATA